MNSDPLLTLTTHRCSELDQLQASFEAAGLPPVDIDFRKMLAEAVERMGEFRCVAQWYSIDSDCLGLLSCHASLSAGATVEQDVQLLSPMQQGSACSLAPFA